MKFSIRLVCFPGISEAQMNIVCVHCHCTTQTRYLHDAFRWIGQHECPYVISIEDVKGNVDPNKLYSELEKRKQL